MADYSSLRNRIEKAIKRVEARTQASSVHIIKIGTDCANLTGLVIILADRPCKKAVVSTIEASQDATS